MIRWLPALRSSDGAPRLWASGCRAASTPRSGCGPASASRCSGQRPAGRAQKRTRGAGDGIRTRDILLGKRSLAIRRRHTSKRVLRGGRTSDMVTGSDQPTSSAPACSQARLSRSLAVAGKTTPRRQPQVRGVVRGEIQLAGELGHLAQRRVERHTLDLHRQGCQQFANLGQVGKIQTTSTFRSTEPLATSSGQIAGARASSPSS